MILRKKKGGLLLPEKVVKRASILETSDLIQWAQPSLYILDKHLSGWQRTRNQFDLDEFVAGTEALYAIALELKKR